MFRLCITTLFFLSACMLPRSAQASASKVAYNFSANVDGAKVTVLRLGSKPPRNIGSCKTPCTLELKPKHVDYVVFQHEAYRILELPKSRFPSQVEDGKTALNIAVDLGPSHSERRAEAARKFEAAKTEALEKGTAKARPWNRIPPLFPIKALKKKRSGWCQLRFDVNALGQTENVSAFNCSKPVFRKNAEASAEKWTYIAAVKDGKFVKETNQTITLHFAFEDKDGKVIPAKKRPPKT